MAKLRARNHNVTMTGYYTKSERDLLIKSKQRSAPPYNPYIVLFLTGWLLFGVFWTMHRKMERPPRAQPVAAQSALHNTGQFDQPMSTLKQ